MNLIYRTCFVFVLLLGVVRKAVSSISTTAFKNINNTMIKQGDSIMTTFRFFEGNTAVKPIKTSTAINHVQHTTKLFQQFFAHQQWCGLALFRQDSRLDHNSLSSYASRQKCGLS
jgi:hypothetical protein